MKFKLFKRKNKKKPQETLNNVDTTAFVHGNMRKASNMERNVDPMSIFKDSYHTVRNSK